MKKIFGRLGLFFLSVLIIIQFFHPKKNESSIATDFVNDISKAYPLPTDIDKILKTSCYDCHSNNTVYPWYSKIQPVGWWLNDHINEGKRELNFSVFKSYRIRKQYKKIDDIIQQVKDDEMPLSSYTLIHKNAILSKDQKLNVTHWATAIKNTIEAKYPADSLKRK